MKVVAPLNHIAARVELKNEEEWNVKTKKSYSNANKTYDCFWCFVNSNTHSRHFFWVNLLIIAGERKTEREIRRERYGERESVAGEEAECNEDPL